jgi:hypothetical protein
MDVYIIFPNIFEPAKTKAWGYNPIRESNHKFWQAPGSPYPKKNMSNINDGKIAEDAKHKYPASWKLPGG